jgi:hypothetical protein
LELCHRSVDQLEHLFLNLIGEWSRQRRGFTVTIYTKDTPPKTTSNIAGGWWAPVTLFEPGRQGSAFE